MPGTFSWLTAFLIFLVYILIDGLYVKYTLYIVNKRPIAGATAAAILYGLLAFGVICYVSCNWYLISVIAGSWLGTYLTIKY